jgi:hypothetical protein
MVTPSQIIDQRIQIQRRYVFARCVTRCVRVAYSDINFPGSHTSPPPLTTNTQLQGELRTACPEERYILTIPPEYGRFRCRLCSVVDNEDSPHGSFFVSSIAHKTSASCHTAGGYLARRVRRLLMFILTQRRVPSSTTSFTSGNSD